MKSLLCREKFSDSASEREKSFSQEDIRVRQRGPLPFTDEGGNEDGAEGRRGITNKNEAIIQIIIYTENEYMYLFHIRYSNLVN